MSKDKELINYYSEKINWENPHLKLTGRKVLLQGLLPSDLGYELWTPDGVMNYESAMVHKIVKKGPGVTDGVTVGHHTLVLRNALDKAEDTGQFVLCDESDIYIHWEPGSYSYHEKWNKESL